MNIDKHSSYIRLFIDYFLRYFIVLLIPILFLIVMIFGYNMDLLEEKILQDYQYKLTQIKNGLDNQLERLLQTSFQLSSLLELDSKFYSSAISSRYELLKTLKSYDTREDFYSLLLYLRGDHLLYKASGTYLLSEFISSDFFFPEWERDALLADLNTSKKRIILPEQQETILSQANSKVIPYIVSIPMLNNSYSGTLIFLIEVSKIVELVKDIHLQENGALFLIDQDKNIISHINLVKDDPKEKYIELLKSMNGVSPLSNSIRDDFFYYSTEINNGELILVSIVQKSSLLSSFYSLRRKIILWIIVICFLSAIILVLVARWHYKPLYNLISFVEIETRRNYESGSEVSFITSGFNEILKIEANLRKVQFKNRIALTDSLLKSFVKGGFKHLQDFNEEAEEVGVHINNSFFLACIVLIENFTFYPCSEIIDEFVFRSSKDLEIFGSESNENNKIILICAAKDGDLANIRITLSQITAKIINEKKISLCVGAGNVYKDPSIIHKSYIEASMALEYSLTKNKLISFSNELALISENNVEYPTDKLEAFDLALFRGDSDWLKEHISFFINFIINKEIPMLITQSLKCDIILIINKHSQHAGFGDFLPFWDIKDLKEFKHLALDLSLRICEFRKNNEIENNNKQLSRMYEYLENNYSNCNFSLQLMSDHFRMSVSGLSHYFKKYAPENISVFVQRKRMEKAKELLETTELHMLEIAEAVGYTNRTSFMKKFKIMVGCTPGEYRALPR